MQHLRKKTLHQKHRQCRRRICETRRHQRDSHSHPHPHHLFGNHDRNTQCRKAFQPIKVPTKVKYRKISLGEEMASSMNSANKEANPRDQQYAISLASRNRPNNQRTRTPNNRYRTTTQHIIAHHFLTMSLSLARMTRNSLTLSRVFESIDSHANTVEEAPIKSAHLHSCSASSVPMDSSSKQTFKTEETSNGGFMKKIVSKTIGVADRILKENNAGLQLKVKAFGSRSTLNVNLGAHSNRSSSSSSASHPTINTRRPCLGMSRS